MKPFYYQLMHIMLKNTELLKHSKITQIMQILLTKCVISSQALTVAP